jgi:iron(III) transport system substrate-binding protein
MFKKSKIKNRFRNSSLILLAVIVLLLSACGQPETPASSTAPADPPSSTKKSESSKESNKQTSETPKQSEWDKVVAAAKKEGKVVISGSSSEAWRKTLVEPFQKKYPEIKVEYTGISGRSFVAKVAKEREVGQYLWDIRIGGVNPTVYKEKDQGTYDPIRPLLTPENAKDSVWQGGLDTLFVDKDKKYFVGFLAYGGAIATVNYNVIPEAEMKSPQDMLNPKFKGKIAILDPRGGSGLGNLATMLAGYGEDFVRDFLTKQDVIITGDDRQLVEWVVRGKYPIGMGLEQAALIPFEKQGLTKNVKDLPEGKRVLSTGYGNIAYFNKAPNPNASRVYINWLLSEEGQKAVTETVQLNSRRIGVPPGDKLLIVDPNKLDLYVAHQREEFVEVRKTAQKLAKELIK